MTLLNTRPLIREFLERAFGTLILLAGAFGLIAIVANYLTNKIVAPVEQTMTAQKRFIADASHELKTPLTVIDANAAVLEKEAGTSKWLDYIKEQTTRMSALVTALLTRQMSLSKATPR
jgi:signal transduction histidine kinase